MKHKKLYVVNEDGIVLGIVKLEGKGVSIVSNGHFKVQVTPV